YRIQVTRSRTLEGPYVDKSGRSALNGGGEIVYASHSYVYGPGGQGVFTEDDGTDVLYYHYVDTRAGFSDFKLLGYNNIEYVAGWPVLANPLFCVQCEISLAEALPSEWAYQGMVCDAPPADGARGEVGGGGLLVRFAPAAISNELGHGYGVALRVAAARALNKVDAPLSVGHREHMEVTNCMLWKGASERPREKKCREHLRSGLDGHKPLKPALQTNRLHTDHSTQYPCEKSLLIRLLIGPAKCSTASPPPSTQSSAVIASQSTAMRVSLQTPGHCGALTGDAIYPRPGDYQVRRDVHKERDPVSGRLASVHRCGVAG
ncbi:hypothetical protein BDK51DRAFT_42424, partial [Blyttiomyces helicus]